MNAEGPIKRLPPEVEAAGIAAMHAMSEAEVIPVYVAPLMLFMLLSHLQLALRHPESTGPSSKQVRHFADMIEGRLKRDFPDVGPLIDCGWNPDYDEPV